MSLAILEYFVHIDMDDAPRDLVMVSAEIPDSVSRVVMEPGHLPPDWWQTPAPPHLTAIGDYFAAQVKAAVLVLPSVLAPPERNWLINPLHPEFARIRVSLPEPFRYDFRFFG
jgi:RES domain-containing protein